MFLKKSKQPLKTTNGLRNKLKAETSSCVYSKTMNWTWTNKKALSQRSKYGKNNTLSCLFVCLFVLVSAEKHLLRQILYVEAEKSLNYVKNSRPILVRMIVTGFPHESLKFKLNSSFFVFDILTKVLPLQEFLANEILTDESTSLLDLGYRR